MKIQKRIEINLDKPGFSYPVKVVQYDTGIQLIFMISDFEIPDGTTVTVFFLKPSGKFVYQEKNITISGNEITVNVENQAFTEKGLVEYQVALTNGNDLITSFSRIVQVEKSLTNSGAEESKTVIAAFDILTAEKIADIQAAALNEIAAAKQEIEDKKDAVLASIPDDYTDTVDRLYQVEKTKSDAVVQTVTGETVSVHDSAEDPIRGLRLFGKSVQDGTPTPDSPVDIVSLAADGGINVNVYGGNLIPFPYADGASKEMNGVTFTVRDDGSILVNGTATETAYLTFNRTTNKIRLPEGWLSTSAGIGYGSGIPHIQNDIYVDGVYVTSVQTATEGSAKRKFTGVVELGASRVKVDAGVTVNNVVVYPILCNSETVLDYELSKGVQTIALSTPSGLPGIPVSSDGNYTDASGQAWICDEIDLERGKYIQRIASITFDGTEGWYISAAQFDKGTRFDLNLSTAPIALRQEALSNRFTYHGPNAAVESCWTLPENYTFRIITEKATTVAELKAFLASNPTTIQYTRYVPIETDLTTEEIQDYKGMISHYPNTTVVNDVGAYMEVSYNADLKTYIGNLKPNGVFLTDTVTGKVYELKVTNGHVIAEGVNQ